MSVASNILGDEAPKANQINPKENLVLKSIHVDCKVKNHLATTLEKRTYVNFDNKPREETFTIDLPDETILTEFVMETEGNVFETNKRDERCAKKDYKDAVSGGVDAALLNLQDATKGTVTVHLAPHSEVIFMLQYEKCLKAKNDKHEIVINIHRETHTEELSVNVNLIEATRIKNVKMPLLRSQNIVMDNEKATIIRTNDNEIHVEFSATVEQQEEIVAALKGKDGNLSGQFIVEYEVEPNLSAAQNSVSITPVPILSSYLVAIRNTN